MPTVLTLNNTTEGRKAPPEAAMAKEYKAGPIRRRPTHPGVMIASNLKALKITPYAAAPELGITKQALGNVIAGKSAVSPEMALRLAQYFDSTPEFWLNLQRSVDLWDARQKIGASLKKVPKRWDSSVIPVEE